MTEIQIIEEVKMLPVQKQMLIIEKGLHYLRNIEEKVILKKAADILYEDYVNDKELTAFSSLEFDEFYESR